MHSTNHQMALEGPYITTNTRLDTGDRTGVHAHLYIRPNAHVHTHKRDRTAKN